MGNEGSIDGNKSQTGNKDDKNKQKVDDKNKNNNTTTKPTNKNDKIPPAPSNQDDNINNKDNNKKGHDKSENSNKTVSDSSENKKENNKVNNKDDDKPNMISAEGTTGVRANLIRHKEINDIEDYFEIVKGAKDSLIFLVKNKSTGSIYLSKKLKKSNLLRKHLDKLRNELDLFKEMDNPHIAKLLEIYEEPKSFYLISEKCEGGDIFDRLSQQNSGKFTEKKAAEIISSVLRAVFYIHSKEICHGNLSLENFLFTSKDKDAPLQLIDFGVSQRYSNTILTVNSISESSPYYVAPELLKSQPFSYSCDMWSIGVMTYILLTGSPPFNASSDREIKQKILRGMYDVGPAKFGKVSKDAKDFVQSLIKMDPEERLTAGQAIKHKWITDASSLSNVVINDDVINSFKNFHSISTMKKTALEAIGFGLNQTEVHEFKKIFESIDTDGNGVLDLKELKDTFIPRGYSEEDIEKLFKTIDSNNTGYISYSEFLAVTVRNIKAIKKDSLLEAFHRLDASGNGYLDIDDFKVLLGEEFDQDEIAKLVKQADTSGDGQIDFDEFVALMSDYLDIKLQE